MATALAAALQERHGPFPPTFVTVLKLVGIRSGRVNIVRSRLRRASIDVTGQRSRRNKTSAP
jgi:hypothetical protein